MANSILGAGIIGLPFAISEAGFFTGLFLLVVLCGVTDWTIRLIVVDAKMCGRGSYIGIMEFCFGWWGRVAVSFFQVGRQGRLRMTFRNRQVALADTASHSLYTVRFRARRVGSDSQTKRGHLDPHRRLWPLTDLPLGLLYFQHVRMWRNHRRHHSLSHPIHLPLSHRPFHSPVSINIRKS